MEIFIYTQCVRIDNGFYEFKIHNRWILKSIWNALQKSIIHMYYGFFMEWI